MHDNEYTHRSKNKSNSLRPNRLISQHGLLSKSTRCENCLFGIKIPENCGHHNIVTFTHIGGSEVGASPPPPLNGSATPTRNPGSAKDTD